MAEYKKNGACERLIAAGCLPQRYKDDEGLVSSLPEVDAFLGTAACEQIADAIENRQTKPLTLFPDPASRGFQDLSKPSDQRKLSADFFSYIKVSEGCSRKCTYCIIPQLRGTQRSRPIEDIGKEAKNLVESGIKEIILTAENTTDYGQDIDDGAGFENVLADLSKNLSLHGVWIRFLYAHPETMSQDIIRTVKNHANICSYYDVPIQHASSNILRKMGRPCSNQTLRDLFGSIRNIDPDAVLRTTIIVGFPGETEDDFKTLLDFVKEIEFDHLGVFTYSDATDLLSHPFRDHVPEEIARKRHDILMAAQAKIFEKRNRNHIGRTYRVLVEENLENRVYIGRTMFQAPDVDGVTFIYADGLEIGAFVNVKMTEAFEYDIAGEAE